MTRRYFFGGIFRGNRITFRYSKLQLCNMFNEFLLFGIRLIINYLNRNKLSEIFVIAQ